MLNRPEAPLKSRFQIAWPGITLQRRIQHPDDLGPRRQPARHFEPRSMMLRQPHSERAQAAQRQKHVVRPGANAEQPDRFGSIGHAFALAEMVPNMMSEWPPIYLVAAWMLMSTP